MTLLAIGLALMALVWAGGLVGLAWSWQRAVAGYEAVGRNVPQDIGRLGAVDVAWLNVRQHTVVWSLFFFGCFLVLALIDLPVWAGLGMALVLGAYYGQIRLAQYEESSGGRPIVFSESLDKVWFAVIVTLEWCGYMGVLMFTASIVVEAVR